MIVSISDFVFTVAGHRVDRAGDLGGRERAASGVYALAAANLIGIVVLVRLARRTLRNQLPHAGPATLRQALAAAALVGVQRHHHQHPGQCLALLVAGIAGRPLTRHWRRFSCCLARCASSAWLS